MLQWVPGCPKSGDYPFHDLHDKVDEKRRDNHSAESPGNPLLRNVTLSVIGGPCEPECVRPPQDNKETAHAATDVHIVFDAVFTPPGVSGGVLAIGGGCRSQYSGATPSTTLTSSSS
jgi:hypothetical protein